MVSLEGGGELVLDLVAFRPVRGARLMIGDGAFVRVRWDVPMRPMLVWFEATAVATPDGQLERPTSFFGQHPAPLFGIPVCDKENFRQHIGEGVLGHQPPTRVPYPNSSDPAVPYVRIRVWVEQHSRVCEAGYDARPPQVAATLVAVERVDWAKP